MAQLEWSEGGNDPRIKDWVMREEIALDGGTSEHRGSVDIPVGVKVEAIHVAVITAVSGGDVYSMEVGISDDGSAFFSNKSTETFTAGSTLFGIFEYAHPRSQPRFDEGTNDLGRQSVMEMPAGVRKVSAGAAASENNARVTLYTKAVDGEDAVTTAGKVHVTVYGRRYIY